MKIEILDEAEADLIEDFHFYEPQKPDSLVYPRTDYFRISILSFYTLKSTTLFSDIIAVSPKIPFCRLLFNRWRVRPCPWVLDCRRNPSWTRKRLKNSDL